MRWWVFVQDVPPRSTPAAWLVGWLPVGHRHVWCAREFEPGWWLIVDAQSTQMRCAVECVGEATAEDVVRCQIASGCTAFEAEVVIDATRPWWRGWLTCVSVTKGLLGIRCWWLLTPAQLVRWAEARGIEVRR